MNSHDRLRAACVLLLVLGSAGSLPARAEELRNHFDTDAIVRPPGFFDLVVLGEAAGAEAKWLILSDTNPPSTPNRLVQTNARRPTGSITAALRRNAAFQDGTVSTFVKMGPGQAGLILRMVDANNFLLLLADTASGDLVLTSYRGGKPAELGRGKGGFQRAWEKIGAKLEGPTVSVSVNDRKVFEATDPKPASGRVGAATAGPGEASFDELLIVF
jgi:hypothetical protein